MRREGESGAIANESEPVCQFAGTCWAACGRRMCLRLRVLEAAVCGIDEIAVAASDLVSSGVCDGALAGYGTFATHQPP